MADPGRRTGNNGKLFALTRFSSHDGEQQASVSIITFGSVAERLGALEKGDTVAPATAQMRLGVFGIPAAALIRATGYANAGIVAGMAIGEVTAVSGRLCEIARTCEGASKRMRR